MSKLMKGCDAVAEAAVRAGCRFYAGYPITPQSNIPEYLANRMPEVGGVFIQGESEVASINMIFGAAGGGTRSMTSSSSPGISLMAEGISYLAGAMLPAVIINVQRGGFGLGSIQPAQQDYFQATRAMGHGGFKNMVLAPYTVQEAVDLVYAAFDYADRDRNPVVVLMDGCLGQVAEAVELPPMRELPEKHPDWAVGNFDEREEFKGRLVSSIGEGTNGERKNLRNLQIAEYMKANDVQVEEYMVEDAEYILTAYGMSARVAKYCIEKLREEGVKVGLIRPITLYPFPYDSFKKLDYSKVKAVIDIEMSIPTQMTDDIQLGVLERAPILTYGHSGGVVIYNEETLDAIRELIGGVENAE